MDIKRIIQCLSVVGIFLPSPLWAVGSYFESLAPDAKMVTVPESVDYLSLPNEEIAQYLGWVNEPELRTLCGGHYYDDASPAGWELDPDIDIDKAPINLMAQYSDYHFYGKSTYRDNISITQPGRQVTANLAHTYTDEDGQFKEVDLLGGVHFRQPGELLVGNVAYVPVEDGEARFELLDLLYRMAFDSNSSDEGAVSEEHRVEGLTAWGHAKRAIQVDRDVIELHHTTYTTCPPSTPYCSWNLHASTVVLNNDTKRGLAYNPVLWVKNIPVLYFPYISFPLSSDRYSGVLFPTISYARDNGFGLSVPYYFNLATNYDDTLTPTAFTNRGAMFENEFRYMTKDSQGRFTTYLLPNDTEFGSFRDSSGSYSDKGGYADLQNDSNTRGAFRFVNATHFNDYWLGDIDFNYASDDYFSTDFPGAFADAGENQLLRSGEVNYFGPHWSFTGLVQGYQTLHPVDQDDVDNQYARVPHLELMADYPDQAFGLEVTADNSFDYFYMEPNPGESTSPTTGDRVDVRPGIDLPFSASYGFFQPEVQVDATGYSLEDQPAGDPANPVRVLPIFNIDSGLYFDRQTSLFDKEYMQTFEPRLFYLYVPYQDQDDLPVFDTSLTTMNYDRLFLTNRFSSDDRIGDANQLSLGLTSRFIDDQTGDEKMNVNIGDIFYFQNRDVALCTTNECRERDEQGVSPVVGKAVYNLSHRWSMRGDAAWNVGQKLFENGEVKLQYHPEPQKLFNIGYNYVHEGNIYTDNDDDDLVNLSQVNLSYAWPVNAVWSSLGSVDVNTRYGNGVSYLLGLEYKGCCYSVRFIFDQALYGVDDGVDQYRRSYFIQFVLKGLGSSGTGSTADLLKSRILGYKDEFEKVYS